MIMALETEDEFAEREDPDRAGEYWAGWEAYRAALAENGVMTGAGGLRPPATSTTVRLRDGQRVVQVRQRFDQGHRKRIHPPLCQVDHRRLVCGAH